MVKATRFVSGGYKQPSKMVGKQKTGKKQQQPQRKKVVTKVVPRRTGLDSHGKAYARLLTDPCAAPLVHPVYSGGDAGFLFRADSVAVPGAGVGNNGGVLHWTPGYVNSSNTELMATPSNDGAANTMVAFNQNPGKAFLTANAKGARCVAACVRIVYPGTESARSGRIHYGHTTASTIDAGDSVVPDQVSQVLQHYTRTPPEAIEVVWRPGFADQEFNDPTEAASASLRDRKTAITVVWAGFPPAVGLTFYFTAIYEWTPKIGQGISNNVTGKNPSKNTLDEVIDAVQSTGYKWVGHAAGNAGMGVGAGAVTALTSLFGIMPARARMRYLNM